MEARPADQSVADRMKSDPLDNLRAPAPPSMSDAGADAGSEAPVNPRKRKKASRACDYCHVNHQPCDNGKPRCSVCDKHNKECSYLRPTKRRGPQKGYRTALNTYKESAAAWGAVLGAIPGLDALIEGHLRTDGGRALLKTIKDASQQDALIARWQQSTVFKTFFPNSALTEGGSTVEGSVAGGEDGEEDDAQIDIFSGHGGTLSKQTTRHHQQQQPPHEQQMPSPAQPLFGFMSPAQTQSPAQPQQQAQSRMEREATSLSDIVAKDAARSMAHAFQTLAPLGFAPNETIADFYDMGSNPDTNQSNNDFGLDDLGTDADQRVYYELLMGRSFGDTSHHP
ncbi:Quinic acid utilization activator [Coniochaeta hoffmannii]|uniref:Quinic acid utilization activator n=1 Tax=Coniochaeta hoffmannii TaxID=91930 RepID=A0AA38R521_9PEZI|nr:Quinic acid utilization activator [Coniochaeta hoffmannii]